MLAPIFVGAVLAQPARATTMAATVGTDFMHPSVVVMFGATILVVSLEE
uniref:Uncharacterized protein n=1 Tax=Ralstonia solanacearum TaxID=305 RepID=A0A0S4TMX1_RALSL|nr:exported protein of unknown function [Ralstonia solanacearum]